MAKTLTLEQAAKVGVWIIVSSALLFAGPWYGAHLVENREATTIIRWLSVVITVVSVVPWIAYVAWGFSVADEYNRRTLILITAIAFVLAMLFSMTSLALWEARLVRDPVIMNLPIAVVIWMVSGLLVLAYEKARGTR